MDSRDSAELEICWSNDIVDDVLVNVRILDRPVVVFSSGVERNETVFGLLRVLLSNVSRSGDGIVESRLKTGNGVSTEDKDERRVRRIRCDGDRVVNDSGVGAGVAMLSDDGGPLL